MVTELRVGETYSTMVAAAIVDQADVLVADGARRAARQRSLRRAEAPGSSSSSSAAAWLLAKGPSNLLLAGRCISSTHEASGCTRATVQCMVTGQAAGVAAALCAQRGVKPRELDAAVLRTTLARQGVIL